VPRLAEVYDALDPDRRDLDAYVDLLDQKGARSVVDMGCGTGTFAIMLASRGIDVTGVDPAQASLAVARAKPRADGVRWQLGDAATAGGGPVDAVTMTGNVAQVFLTDEDWRRALRGAANLLRPDGHLVFETRDPAAQAWQGWHREATYRAAEIDGIGSVACWEDVTAVAWPLVSFQTTFEFHQDGATLTSESTLRFRERDEIVDSLREAGFRQPEVHEAPDRPNLELIFVAQREAT
jgi:SAM-dependent methyltransferase